MLLVYHPLCLVAVSWHPFCLLIIWTTRPNDGWKSIHVLNNKHCWLNMHVVSTTLNCFMRWLYLHLSFMKSGTIYVLRLVALVAWICCPFPSGNRTRRFQKMGGPSNGCLPTKWVQQVFGMIKAKGCSNLQWLIPTLTSVPTFDIVPMDGCSRVFEIQRIPLPCDWVSCQSNRCTAPWCSWSHG